MSSINNITSVLEKRKFTGRNGRIYDFEGHIENGMPKKGKLTSTDGIIF